VPLRIAPLLRPVGAAAAGMRFCFIAIDAAAPGRSAHHPGITPGGVICGGRDHSPVGRSVGVAGPRAAASTLIRTADAAPGIILPGAVQLGRQAPLL